MDRALYQALDSDVDELLKFLPRLLSPAAQGAQGQRYKAYRLAYRFWSDARLLGYEASQSLAAALMVPLESAWKHAVELDARGSETLKRGVALLQKRRGRLQVPLNAAERHFITTYAESPS